VHIIDIKRLLAAGDGTHRVPAERQRLRGRKLRRERALQGIAVRVVEHRVHAAAVIVDVVIAKLPVFILDAVGVMLEHAHETRLGVVCDDRAVDGKQEREHQRLDDEHHERKPRRDADLE